MFSDEFLEFRGKILKVFLSAFEIERSKIEVNTDEKAIN